MGIDVGSVRLGKVYTFTNPIKKEDLADFTKTILAQPIAQDVYVDTLPELDGCTRLIIGKKPGVTDDEGLTVQRLLGEYLGLDEGETQSVFVKNVYYFEKELNFTTLERIGSELLGNALIHNFEQDLVQGMLKPPAPHPPKQYYLLDLSDEALMDLSCARHLALNLEEMLAIKAYFQQADTSAKRQAVSLPNMPTDCELEILGQTWSEHCKHKEFNAIIDYTDKETGDKRTIHSLFKSKIQKATEVIAARLEEHGQDWLVKVFSDNAGIVKISKDWGLTWKVETHNTPSALDPYGGAITGVLGCNRDAVGTGVGGAKLLFNTNVLCFGPPDYDEKLQEGQLHPRRVLQGVVRGIIDAGNKTGIPTVNGSIHFDERFSGKPLVFCGSAALLPLQVAGKDASKKPISSGDLIVMAGGRVGKDGIHGATLSSQGADASTPQTMVQIGSPGTQKCLFDFLEVASFRGLIKTCTDNGAGGLSSSVGELASISGGARVFLEKVPLKYPGLQPWEIFLSESQERMTLAVDPSFWDALVVLAQSFEVELSSIGCFTDTGILDVRYHGECIAYLDLLFLHDGVPQKHLEAVWERPKHPEPKLSKTLDYNQVLLDLLKSYNICSREPVIRRYDHEVKGLSCIKPLMGFARYSPQDAAVMRVELDGVLGVAVSNGITPSYGDIDAYAMCLGAFDEAVRQIIAVGGALPDLKDPKCAVWSVNDNFCMPDVAYDPVNNPDGKYKLAQLVRMCDALYDIATQYQIPLTSGKDSMKNDFLGKDKKISIPATVLFSMVSTIKDVRKVVTTEFKSCGDLIYLLGETYRELGGSSFYALLGALGNEVPKVRPYKAKALYQKVARLHTKGLLTSCHDLSDGGLAVSLAECLFANELGATIHLPQCKLEPQEYLFSQTHSRFVVSVRPKYQDLFEAIMQGDATLLGIVTQEPKLSVFSGKKLLISEAVNTLYQAWSEGLSL